MIPALRLVDAPQVRTVFDVGAHNGEDTARYLSMGYRVIAIEAAPNIADKLRVRFAREIASGMCEILNIGAGEVAGTLPFYLSRDSEWNSFDRGMAARAGEVREVLIPVRPLGAIIAEYGEPEFVKIDVEGADSACVRSMTGYQPAFMSFEAGADAGEMIALLHQRGYRSFALVNQYNHKPVVLPKPGTLAFVKWAGRQWARQQLRKHKWIHGRARQAKTTGHQWTQSSGPPPMEVTTGWHSLSQALWVWESAVQSGMVDSTWFDVHARR